MAGLCLNLTAAVVGLILVVLVYINHEADGKLRTIFPPPKFRIDDVPSLNDKVAIITGANVGLGRESAIQLAKKGARVVLACRSSCDDVVAEIAKQGGVALSMKLDLSDSVSISTFANEYRKMGLPIHILMLNAGVMMMPEFTITKDGLEMQTGVNFIGHFYLQQLLQDIVEKSAPSRIIILTSKGHIQAPAIIPNGLGIRDTPENRKEYGAMRNYGLSKLFNILHAKELDAQMRKSKKKVYVVAVHPGAVDTDLGRHVEEFINRYLPRVLSDTFKVIVANILTLNVHDGALTQIWAASSSDIVDKNLSGSYAVPIARTNPGSLHARDVELQKRVWREAEDIIRSFPRKA